MAFSFLDKPLLYARMSVYPLQVSSYVMKISLTFTFVKVLFFISLFPAASVARYVRKVKPAFIVSTFLAMKKIASAAQCSTGALLRML